MSVSGSMRGGSVGSSCDVECPQACNDSGFKTKITYAMWPNIHSTVILLGTTFLKLPLNPVTLRTRCWKRWAREAMSLTRL